LAFVAEACAPDAELWSGGEALLAASDGVAGFLAGGTADSAAGDTSRVAVLTAALTGPYVSSSARSIGRVGR